MDDGTPIQIVGLAGFGLVAGLVLLARGFAGYRTAARIADIATSRIATLAAGEVRVTGTVEPAEVLLTSALQSAPCVYYRSSVRARGDDDRNRTVFEDERAVGFRVRDATGDLRVFPRRARWDVPSRFKESSAGGEPAALRLRSGGAYRSSEPDRAALIEDLLTPDPAPGSGADFGAAAGGQREYAEARLEPGDVVTVVGRAMPFGSLNDPTEADMAGIELVGDDDPEVARNVAEAREAGMLVGDPAVAWGNAAIPGFGIGRPVSPPVLDAEAERPGLATAGEAARISRTFEIPPEQLVLAAAPDMPLLVTAGPPSAAAARNRLTFLVGLGGALLAIGSAIVLALAVTSGVAA